MPIQTDSIFTTVEEVKLSPVFWFDCIVLVCLLVGLLVCQQDPAKTAEQVFMKLGWRMCHDPDGPR